MLRVEEDKRGFAGREGVGEVGGEEIGEEEGGGGLVEEGC